MFLAAGLASSLAAPAAAQCDPSPRIVWSYPESGASEVAYGAPLLIRTTAEIHAVRVTTSEYEASSVMSALPLLFGDVVVEPGVLGLYLRTAGPVSIELTTTQGELLPLAFSASGELPPEQPAASFQGHIDGHFVADGLERLSLRCRSIATAPNPGGSGCVDPASAQMIGLDTRITDLATGMPADVEVRAWMFAPVGDHAPILHSWRLWPADCGLPMFIVSEGDDHASTCVNVVAFADGPQSRIGFGGEYCLGGGQPWPEPEAPDAGIAEPDASIALPDAGWVMPPMGPCGPCGCNVIGCDLIDPGGMAGTMNGAGTGGGAAGTSAGQGGAAASAGATSEGARATSSGCGCSIAQRSERSALWLLLLFALIARRLQGRFREP